MTLLEQIKAELRINHTQLDALLNVTAEEAVAELKRCGLSTVDTTNNANHQRAVKDYVLARHCDDEKRRELYENAYKVEYDQLRKGRVSE